MSLGIWLNVFETEDSLVQSYGVKEMILNGENES